MKKAIDVSILRGPQFYSFSDCYLDTVERRLFKKNRRLDVTPRVLEVLQVLVENAGDVVSKDDLLDQIWGESFVEEGNLPVQISKLRSVLGASKDEPYIVTESGVGYKFVSRVRMVDDDEWSDIIENKLSQREDGKQQFTSIAIMPLLNENGDEDIEYLADGITESLINTLSHIPELRVIARNTVFQFKDKEVDIKKLGRRLRVATILTGRVRLVQNNLVIGVELTKVSDGTQIWGTRINESFDDIFEVQEKISEAIGGELRLRIDGLSLSERKLQKEYDFEPYRLYLKGRYFLRRGGADNLPKAIECFQESMSIDPARRIVYLELANCHILRHAYDLSSLEQVKSETKKLLNHAESLPGDIAGILCLKARIAINIEWDISKAGKLFQKSLSKNPTSDSCNCSYANLLANLGMFSEAMGIARTILRLDPISVRNQRSVARILYKSEQFESAAVLLNEALEFDPASYDTLLLLAAINIELENFEFALDLITKARLAHKGLETLALRGYAYAKAGESERATKVQKHLEALAGDGDVPFVYSSYISAALGNRDAAFESVDKSIRNHEMNILSFRSNPMLASLREDPRYMKVVEMLGLDIRI